MKISKLIIFTLLVFFAIKLNGQVNVKKLNSQVEKTMIVFLNDTLFYNYLPPKIIYQLDDIAFRNGLIKIQNEYIPTLAKGRMDVFWDSDLKEFWNEIEWINNKYPTLIPLKDYYLLYDKCLKEKRKKETKDSLVVVSKQREVFVRDSLKRDSVLKIAIEKLRKKDSAISSTVTTNEIINQPWQKYNLDSTSFLEQFGSIEQYGYQKSIQQRSSHGQLCVLIGAKAVWLYNFATYLALKGYNVDWDEPDNFQGVIILATPKIYTSSKPPIIKVVAPYNNSLQITSVTITGPADDIINIFLGYWELSNISVNELKTKKAITKEFVSDKISFSWLEANPKILVTKNPNTPIDLFLIK